jgi:DNA-3-methyladenine glycosylase I
LKKTFVFTGGEIVNEFLVSSGYLPGAHDLECPVYKQIVKLDPPWMKPLPKRLAGVPGDDKKGKPGRV